MNEQELNKKLNDWAFTTDVDYTHSVFGIAYCFKWLVPKVKQTLLHTETPFETFRLWDEIKASIWTGDNPALALCKAIEKLIDGEK